MKRSESKEMYLEVIYDIHNAGKKIRITDIANKLGFSKASVNRGVNNLEKEGLVEKEFYGDIKLTETGYEMAKGIKEIHDLLTDFLMSSLDLPRNIAENDACRIEHVVSDDTIGAIRNYLSNK